MKKWMIACLLMLVMLLCIGCGKNTEPVEQVEDLPKQTEVQVPKKTEKKAEEKDKKEQNKKEEEKQKEEENKQAEDNKDQPAKTEAQTQKSSGSQTKSKKPSGFTSSKAYYIKVNRQMNTVTVYTKDSDGLFTVPCRAMVCSTGGSETPLGTYDISYAGRWNWLGLVGGVCGQYCTQISGDILFHSVPYTERYNKGSLQPGEYDKLGTSCSHGCVRLTVADAKWIYDNKDNIARVEIYNSSDPGPLGKPYAQKIGSSAYKGWDPTDPDSNNPWHNAKVKVGNYVGKTEADAKEAAQTLGLTIGASTKQYSDKAKGTVIAQSLSSGSSVKQGTKITFTISNGPAPVTVGSYVGMTESAAASAAKSAGLSVGSATYQYSDSPEGTVLAQSLSSGKSVTKGTTITFTVSKGLAPVTVGSYIGMTLDEAEAAINSLGLNVDVTTVEGENDNQVVDQSIGAGSSVAAGSTIVLTVSKVVEQAVETEG